LAFTHAGGEMIQPSLAGLSSMMNNFPTIGFGPNGFVVSSFGGPNHGGLLSCVPFGDSGQTLSGLIAHHAAECCHRKKTARCIHQ
jgi:hypothetical protein